MINIINKIENLVIQSSLFSDKDYVLACLSGGADSMAMVYILNNMQKKGMFKKLYCCHVNHNLRGIDSDNDQLFVEHFCTDNNIECFILSENINEIAQKTKTSIELCARNVRYDFFNNCCNKIKNIENCDIAQVKIATAHHLNDNIETVLLNFIRGTTIKGLCGIPIKRDNIIRPLINCTRLEIENFCTDNDINYVTDKTNFSTDYTRNKIRHYISPVLFQINPSFDKTFKESIENINQDEDFLNQFSLNAYKQCIINQNDKIIINNKFFLKNHISIQKRIIAILLGKHKIEINKSKINLIMKVILGEIKTIELKKNIYLQNFNTDTILIKKEYNNKNKVDYPPVILDLNSKNIYTFKDKNVIIEYPKKSQSDNDMNFIYKNFNIICKKVLTIYLNYDKIFGSICVRLKQDGDYIYLENRKITKTLKKLFNEMKISLKDRENSIIITDEKSILAIVINDKIIYSHNLNKTDENILKLIIFN